jgi:hypothetical protein
MLWYIHMSISFLLPTVSHRRCRYVWQPEGPKGTIILKVSKIDHFWLISLAAILQEVH